MVLRWSAIHLFLNYICTLEQTTFGLLNNQIQNPIDLLNESIGCFNNHGTKEIYERH